MQKSDLQGVGKFYEKLSGRGVHFKDDELGGSKRTAKGKEAPRKLTEKQKKEEADKKKKQMIEQAKAKKKKGETLESRMG